jgi:hypothetical protein
MLTTDYRLLSTVYSNDLEKSHIAAITTIVVMMTAR